jgi:hypothetical protein
MEIFDSTPAAHPSRYFVARFLTGELAAPQEHAYHEHLRVCDACLKSHGEARREASAFFAAYPGLETLVWRPSRPSRAFAPASPTLWTRIAGALRGPGGVPRLAAAALILAFAASFWQSHGAPLQDLTAKGDSRFYLFVNGKQMVKDTLECRTLDTLQLGLRSVEPMHYAVLYRDDREGIQAYMESDNGAVGNPKGENLPHSLVLKGDWKRETLFCIWSPQPFSRAEAVAFAGGTPYRAAGIRLRLQTYHLINRP